MSTTSKGDEDPRVAGAYGLQVIGLPAGSRLLGQVSPIAPTLHFSVSRAAADQSPTRIDANHASLLLRDGSRYEIERASARAVLTTSHDLAADDLVHPYLAPAAALVQQWLGREALHAGAFVVDGEAVLVLAPREGGKSSTLAHLAMEEGVAVLADDLAVLDRGQVLAGPRCLDLRSTTAQAHAERWQGRLVRSASRTRLQLPPAPQPAPLRAVVVLAWGAPAVEEVPGRQTLPLLARQRMHGSRLGTGSGLLEVAAVPVMRVTRRQRIEELPDSARLVLSAVR